MRKYILDFIIKFLMENFAIEADEKNAMNCVSDQQLEQLLKALNREYKVELKLYDVLSYIQKYNMTLGDLSGIVFNKLTC